MAGVSTKSDIFEIRLYPRDSDNSNQWPKLSCSEANRLDITDTTNLTVNGAIAATALSVTEAVTADAFEGDGSALVGLVKTTGDNTMTGSLTIQNSLTVNNVSIESNGETNNLNIKGNLTLDTGQSPVLYTGTENTELNRYLQLINSPERTSASGLKAGGVLVSDSYAYANPNKNDLIVKGNIGIGTASPNKKLHVNGEVQIGLTNGTNGQLIIYGPSYVEGGGLIIRRSDSGVYMRLDQNKIDTINTPLYLNNYTPTSSPTLRAVIVGSRMSVDGNLYVTGDITARGSKSGYITDRFINQSGELLEQGDVVVLGKKSAEVCYGLDDNIPVPEVDLTTTAYERRVCGIVSEILVEEELQLPNAETIAQGQAEPLGKARGVYRDRIEQLQVFSDEEIEKLDRKKVGPGQFGNMVTLGCFAHCKVDADIAPIAVGDLLTTSPTKGHAQKVLDFEKATGAIIGKALKSLEKYKGKIPILVMLQ